MYPEINFTFTQNPVILRSFLWGFYLGISTTSGEPKMITKSLKNMDDPELQFQMHYYTAAEANETKLILLMHEATGTFFRMTSDRRLVVQSADELNNDVNLPVSPRKIKHADNRFFYMKNAGEGDSNCVLEPMNGVDYNYLVVVPGEGQPPELQLTTPGSQIPMEAFFTIQDSRAHEHDSPAELQEKNFIDNFVV